MILYSSVICFVPRNGSCNFKLDPGEGGGSWRNTFRALCSHRYSSTLSLSVLSQQREGELNSLLLASFFFVSWGKKFFPGLWLLLLELFSFALVQTPGCNQEPHTTAQQGGPGMSNPSSGPREKPSRALKSTSLPCSKKVQILTVFWLAFFPCTLCALYLLNSFFPFPPINSFHIGGGVLKSAFFRGDVHFRVLPPNLSQTETSF